MWVSVSLLVSLSICPKHSGQFLAAHTSVRVGNAPLRTTSVCGKADVCRELIIPSVLPAMTCSHIRLHSYSLCVKSQFGQVALHRPWQNPIEKSTSWEFWNGNSLEWIRRHYDNDGLYIRMDYFNCFIYINANDTPSKRRKATSWSGFRSIGTHLFSVYGSCRRGAMCTHITSTLCPCPQSDFREAGLSNDTQ